MAQSLHDRIKGYEKSQAEAYMAEVPAACAKGDREAVYHLLREYIRCPLRACRRRLLVGRLRRGFSEYSIRKLLRLQKDEPLHDISMTCTGAPSVTTRKVLLLLTIQKKLGFKFAYTESPDIETVPQLVDAVMRHMAEAHDGVRPAGE